MQNFDNYELNNNSLFIKYRSFLRFVLVGLLNTSVDFFVFTIFHSLFFLDVSFSQSAGYITGTLNSFVLNKLWTFENQKTKKVTTIKQFLKFILVNIVSLIISVILIRNLTYSLNLNPYFSKIIVTVITQFVNYYGYKLWVFNK
ncbi:GtrA family protein [Caldicellulosiruptoraceae bacterium PP1]